MQFWAFCAFLRQIPAILTGLTGCSGLREKGILQMDSFAPAYSTLLAFAPHCGTNSFRHFPKCLKSVSPVGKTSADTRFTRCSTAKFSGVRVETEYEQTAAFGVLAAMRSPLQTINQFAYSTALNPARSNIWLPPRRFERRLIAMFKGHNRNLHTSACCQFLLPPCAFRALLRQMGSVSSRILQILFFRQKSWAIAPAVLLNFVVCPIQCAKLLPAKEKG
jgi:hypothetical protein